MLAVVVGVLAAKPSTAQTVDTIDSLENVVLRKDLADTTRIKTLSALGVAYAENELVKSRKTFDEALALAHKIKNYALAYTISRQAGAVFYAKGDYTNAMELERTGLESAQLLGDSIKIGATHNNVGNYYYEIGEYDEAYYHLTHSYSILERSAKTHQDSVAANVALHNLGRVFKEVGQYDIAIKHLEASRKISRLLNDYEGEPYSLDEIGDTKLKMQEYDSALYYLNASLTETNKLLAEIPLLAHLKSKTFLKIAKLYTIRNDYTKALAYYDSTANLHNVSGNRFGIAEVDLGRGDVYMHQEKYNEALTFTNQALVLATSKEANARVLEIACYKQLSAIWEIKGDYKKALGYARQYNALNDSLFSTEIQEKVLRDQINMQTAALGGQLAALTLKEEDRETQLKRSEFIRNILVVLVALSVILLATVYRSGQRRKQINGLLLKHQEEMQKRSEELEQLNEVKDKFFSIISHDLRSPINALAGLMDLLDKGAVAPEELPVAITELKKRFNHTRTLLNNLLDWTVLQMEKIHLQAGSVYLHKIVAENVELLTSLQTKQVNLINRVPENLVGYADSNTINLVIRNLITNGIKFTNDGGEVSVSARDNGKEIEVSVTDNGIGMNAEAQARLFNEITPYSTRGTANEKGTGLGLILCKEFVEKNGGRIWVESTEGKGSTFSFTLPKA